MESIPLDLSRFNADVAIPSLMQLFFSFNLLLIQVLILLLLLLSQLFLSLLIWRAALFTNAERASVAGVGSIVFTAQAKDDNDGDDSNLVADAEERNLVADAEDINLLVELIFAKLANDSIGDCGRNGPVDMLLSFVWELCCVGVRIDAASDDAGAAERTGELCCFSCCDCDDDFGCCCCNASTLLGSVVAGNADGKKDVFPAEAVDTVTG